MTYRGGVVTGVLGTLLVAAGVAAVWWAFAGKRGDAAKPAPPPLPATVTKPLKEDQINVVVLTPDAEMRLVVGLGKVESKSMPRTRTYGGEVVIPPGRAVIVSAPLAGTLKAVTSFDLTPGRAVTKGQPVFQLYPLLTPDGRANMLVARDSADADVKNALELLNAAKVAAKIARSALGSGAGRQRDVDDADAQVNVRQKAADAATARRDQLGALVKQAESGAADALPIESPEGGVLRNVSALPGQLVPSGAALFEVVDLDSLWVRVPVYAADLESLDTKAAANIAPLSAKPGAPSVNAKPAAAPPTANPLTGTTDLYYALDNKTAKHSPGERRAVAVTLREPAESLVVPWTAVVTDIHGGTWVYEKTADRTYSRKRVSVRYVAGETAVLSDGPPVGTPVVVAGAAELFGTETGFSK
ncbi:MAG TPA: efflux RND transporter periplasmic adaptor subunit [Gemmataceae bacterium]|nr:efflux RND transporter periplasmic adaptor subunit [Gemmataceae bacterium]